MLLIFERSKKTSLHSPLAHYVVQTGAGRLLRDIALTALPVVPIIAFAPLASAGLPAAAAGALRVSRVAAIGIPFLLRGIKSLLPGKDGSGKSYPRAQAFCMIHSS